MFFKFRYYLLVLLFASTFQILSQESEFQLEIFTLTTGFGEYDVTRFRLDPLGEVYCTDSYSNYFHVPNERNTIALEEVTGNNSGGYLGLQICFNDDSDYGKFWLGLYKFSIQYFNGGEWIDYFHFYIDYRDCWYGRSGIGGCNSSDIVIKYDNNLGKTFWAYGIPTPNTQYTELTQNEVLNWWEANECDSHCVEDFESIIFPQLENVIINQQNHVQLNWSEPDPAYDIVTNYQVWRMMFSGRYAGQFKLRTTVSSSVTSYTDLSLDITQNQNGELLQYKVVALFQSKPDEPSNIQKIRFYFNEGKNVFEVNQTMDFELSQNIPNPFNPSTSISYSIPENAFVALKIYDVLGNEVEVLINEQKEPGNYQIDFNASELSSGIYYYTLTEGNFTSTKKMILVK